MVASDYLNQCVLPYPSKKSVSDLALAIVERTSPGNHQPNPDDRQPNYLTELDDVQSYILLDAVAGAINAVEPAPWLVRELERYETEIAEGTIEILNETPIGRGFIAAMQNALLPRSRAERRADRAESDDAR